MVLLLAFMRPETARTTLLVMVAGGYLLYYLIHWLRHRKKTSPSKVSPTVSSAREVTSPSVSPAVVETKENSRPVDEPEAVVVPLPVTPSPVQAPSPTTSDSLSGEEIYVQARSMPHQAIPNFECDDEYLRLLGAASDKGYARASTKLGEYAMRRAAWVEAYYWMSLAKCQGMHNLSAVMREIRKNWSMAGFPNEMGNVNSLFKIEASSIGRALLALDSGRDAAGARKFLLANYPRFLRCN